jgi:hypothetical protein
MDKLLKHHYLFNSLDIIQKHKNYNSIVEANFIAFIQKGWGDNAVQIITDRIHNCPSLVYVMIGKPNLTKHFECSIAYQEFCVIGYIVLCDNCFYENLFDCYKIEDLFKKCRFIDIMDCRVNGYGIAEYMISNVELKFKGNIILPFIISENAVGYWKKYFAKKYNIHTKQDLLGFCELNKLGNLYNDLYII